MISSDTAMRQTKKEALSGESDISQTSGSSDKDTNTVLISDHSSLEDEQLEIDFLEEVDPVPSNGDQRSTPSTSPDSDTDTPQCLSQPIHQPQEAKEDEEESVTEYCAEDNCILC